MPLAISTATQIRPSVEKRRAHPQRRASRVAEHKHQRGQRAQPSAGCQQVRDIEPIRGEIAGLVARNRMPGPASEPR